MTMPMLTETTTSRPCSSNGLETAATSRSATARASAALWTPASSTVNSSPPSRASVHSPSNLRHRVGAAQRLLEPPRDPDQELVAGEVAQAVVDDLEAVDVEEEHREVAARRRRGVACAISWFSAIHEQHAVGQAGQRIGPARGQLRPDARLRDREVDRLGHVVVGAGVERLDDVVAAVLRGHHDDRQLGDRARLPQPPQRLDAVHARHHHVEQHEIDAVGARRCRAPPRRSRRSGPDSPRATGVAAARRDSSARRPPAAMWSSTDSCRAPFRRRAAVMPRPSHFARAAPRSSPAAAGTEPAWYRTRRRRPASALSRSLVIACALNTMIGMRRVAAIGLQPPRGFPAVDARQAEIHQDRDRAVRARPIATACSPSTASTHAIASPLEPTRERVAAQLVVFHHQDRRHSSVRRRLRGALPRERPHVSPLRHDLRRAGGR